MISDERDIPPTSRGVLALYIHTGYIDLRLPQRYDSTCSILSMEGTRPLHELILPTSPLSVRVHFTTVEYRTPRIGVSLALLIPDPQEEQTGKMASQEKKKGSRSANLAAV